MVDYTRFHLETKREGPERTSLFETVCLRDLSNRLQVLLFLILHPIQKTDGRKSALLHVHTIDKNPAHAEVPCVRATTVRFAQIVPHFQCHIPTTFTIS